MWLFFREPWLNKPAVVYFPVFWRGEGGHDTFTSRFICSKTTVLVFSDWSRNNTYELLQKPDRLLVAVIRLVVIFQRDFWPEAGQKTEWWASFCEDEFSFASVEAPTNFNYNSPKADCCWGDVLPVLLAGFMKTTKVWECFRTVYKMRTAIYFPARLFG